MVHRKQRNGKIRLAFAAFFFLAATGTPERARAELYQYKDADGHTHYVDSLNKVPEQYRGNVRTIDGKELQSYPDKEDGNAGGAKGSTGDKTVPAIPTDSEGHTRAYWCQKRVGLEQRIKELEAEKAKLESTGAVDLDQAAGVAAIKSIAEDKERIEKDLAAVRKELDGLSNEVRKAGGPPGWVKGVTCPTDGPLTAGPGAKKKVPGEEEAKKPPLEKDRDWWKKRKKDLEDRKKELTAQIAEQESRVANAGQTYDPVLAARAEEARTKKAGLEKELEGVERDLKSLAVEARKAGVPAEWVR
ncbi:MAG: hypothetical protein AB1405_07515 [Bdellovibrionota bacterium]